MVYDILEKRIHFLEAGMEANNETIYACTVEVHFFFISKVK
jgi:hypothetical protein